MSRKGNRAQRRAEAKKIGVNKPVYVRRGSFDPNETFYSHMDQSARDMTKDGTPLIGALMIAIDANGYISMSSYRLPQVSIKYLLEQTLALNARKTPDAKDVKMIADDGSLVPLTEAQGEVLNPTPPLSSPIDSPSPTDEQPSVGTIYEDPSIDLTKVH